MITINPNDIRWELHTFYARSWFFGNLLMFKRNGVQAYHVPSGIHTACAKYRSLDKNKAACIAFIEKELSK